MIYHLQVVAHSTKYGDLIERDSFYSNVHGTLKKSVEDGLCWLNNRLQDLLQLNRKKQDYAIDVHLQNGQNYKIKTQ